MMLAKFSSLIPKHILNENARMTVLQSIGRFAVGVTII